MSLDRFMEVYEEELKKARIEKPNMYRWPVEELPIVVKKMREAIRVGRMNKDGVAFMRTCKVLKIAYTYKAIAEYVKPAKLGYPADWPECPGCGEPCLDGKTTCGLVTCGSTTGR